MSKFHVTIGTAVIGTLSLAALAEASPAFQIAPLATGYALSQAAEGKCGEGKCAAAKLDANHDGKVSYAEAQAHGFSESQCKTWDKDADGSLASNELAAMHAILDAPEKKKSR